MCLKGYLLEFKNKTGKLIGSSTRSEQIGLLKYLRMSKYFYQLYVIHDLI